MARLIAGTYCAACNAGAHDACTGCKCDCQKRKSGVEVKVIHVDPNETWLNVLRLAEAA